MAMPNRIAMGAAAWWEPLAAALTIAVIAVLVRFAGRVYSHAILHGGPTLKLRDAWRGTTALPCDASETDALPAGGQQRKAHPASGSNARQVG
jgi:hypothetical protein